MRKGEQSLLQRIIFADDCGVSKPVPTLQHIYHQYLQLTARHDPENEVSNRGYLPYRTLGEHNIPGRSSRGHGTISRPWEFDYLDSATQLNQIDDLSHAPYSSPSTTNFRSVKEPLLLCTARPRYQATYTTWHRPQRPSPNSNPDERAGHPTLACRLTDRTKPRGDNAYNSQTKGLSIRHPSPLQGWRTLINQESSTQTQMRITWVVSMVQGKWRERRTEASGRRRLQGEPQLICNINNVLGWTRRSSLIYIYIPEVTMAKTTCKTKYLIPKHDHQRQQIAGMLVMIAGNTQKARNY
jgi:hypothetical protein